MLRKCLAVLLAGLALLPVQALSVSAAESGLSISAQSAVLMNADTLEILYEKNGDTQRTMASTTKIMTSILALEQGTPNRLIEMTDEMVQVEGTSLGLLAGDYITLEHLVYGMLLESGNDAANAAALAIAGSFEDFAVMMNEKAAEIGMENSSFVTPSGLDAEDHYSTAYDMALLAAYCMQNPEFAYIARQESAVISFGNPPQNRTISNHNRLLSLYEYAVGIKTGFTKKSGRCLISAAEKDGVRLVCVTLNAGDDWNDAQKLFDYGFSETQMIQLEEETGLAQTLAVAGGTQDTAALQLASIPVYGVADQGTVGEITSVLHLKQFEYAPLEAGTVVGYMYYYSDGRQVAEVPVIAAETVERYDILEEQKQEGFFRRIIQWFQNLFKR